MVDYRGQSSSVGKSQVIRLSQGGGGVVSIDYREIEGMDESCRGQSKKIRFGSFCFCVVFVFQMLRFLEDEEKYLIDQNRGW